MQKLILSVLLLASSVGASQAADAPLWMRHQRISPDGKTIAFCYKGDIYTVPTSGGMAVRLTTNQAYDHTPIWSVDGKHIAFSSDREGSDDVYVMSAHGGVARRLTYSSSGEEPLAFLADGKVLYSSLATLPHRTYDQHPDGALGYIYSVSAEGGRPQLVHSLQMQSLSIASDGKILYQDYKGYEDPWRKHHISPIARDIWVTDRKATKHTKLTTFGGEDRNPVWDDKGGFYYLSEESGTLNVYHRSTTAVDTKGRQLTSFKGNPVRFLSRSADGTLCFGYDGEIYTLRDGGKPQKVSVSIVSDAEERDVLKSILRSGVSSYAIAPSGKEVAFVVMGDVYVANVEFGTTKRITNTPEQERSVDFAADGRSIVYAGERGGQWQIYRAELVRKDDQNFAYAREIKETQLTSSKLPSFQPQFSPDGKEVAFLRNRTGIFVYNLASGKEREVMPSNINYSYSDGDQTFEWSPDGHYILTNYMGNGGWNHVDCAIYKADGSGLLVNLTQSAYNETGRWALGGKAVLFFSDRSGMRSHGSWGATGDLYLMFLDRKAYDEFLLNKEERALSKAMKEQAEKNKKAEADKKATKKDDKKSGKKADSKKDDKKDEASKDKKLATKPMTFELENRENLVLRLTQASGIVGDARLNKEGTKLYYVARYGTSYDLWVFDVVERSSRVLVPNASGNLMFAADGKSLFIGGRSGIQKVEESGKTVRVDFAAEFERKVKAERSHVFEHIWQQTLNKFYVPDMHGVDWKYYHGVYKKFLPHISNNRDFAEMLSEMLGELNASHTGARFYRTTSPELTGMLGAFYDQSYEGDGLRIEEILLGSPLESAERKIKPGMIIDKVDGLLIKSGTPIEPYFAGKVGKRTVITVRDGESSFEIVVKPITTVAERELLYRRWLRQREALVHKWSNGRIGYVYVRNMNSQNFRSVFKDLLGKYRSCDAVVVDTRYNGGGWLHEDLAILLSGRKFLSFNPRGQFIGDDPFMQWNKPSCVLMNEGNYSNGHGFPYVYKALGIGKLIGAPVAGTMTAVWWEMQFNGSVVFGIPQVTCSDLDGKPLENQTLQPDIEVYNAPEHYLSGDDVQLRRSVEEMLRTIPKR